jgi:hypothetical protein
MTVVVVGMRVVVWSSPDPLPRKRANRTAMTPTNSRIHCQLYTWRKGSGSRLQTPVATPLTPGRPIAVF